MNSGSKIVSTLRQELLSAFKNKKTEFYNFDRSFEGLSLQAEIEDFDKFSFVFRKLNIGFAENSSSVNIPFDELKKSIDKFTARVTYLLENFSVVEKDEKNQRVLLRSQTPDRKETKLSYYELIIQTNGTISFQRYLFSQEPKKREAIPFHLTNELLEKLLDDISLCFKF